MNKTKTFFVHFPGDIYALQLFDCSNLKEAKQEARIFINKARLPKGTNVYFNERG